jgi:Kef-type K+ transport system membrane component KefB
MVGIGILLIGAAVAHGFARWLNLPVIPFLLLAGISLSTLGVLPVDILSSTLVLGLTFLLFATGIELSPGRVGAQRRAALQVGILQFLTLGALGTLASFALGFDALTAVYVGLALAASSTLVIVRLLQRRRQLFEPFGRLVVGVLLLQDLLLILLIPLVMQAPFGVWAMARSVLETLALVVLAFAVLRWVTPQLSRLQDEEEVLLLTVIAILFLFVALANLLDLPLAAGAFLAGISLSSFPARGITRAQLSSLSDFFSAVFFLSLGGMLTLPTGQQLLQAAVLALIVLLATPPLVALITERAGFLARPAIESGLLLSQTSELSMIVALQGLVLGQIGQGVFNVIALVTVSTMMLTPLFTSEALVERLLRLHPLRRRRPTVAEFDGHVLLVGAGSGGMPLIEMLIGQGEEVFVVDDDPEIIQRLQDGDVPCLRGDASDPNVLQTARADRARIITSTIRRPRDNQRLLDYAGNETPVLVRVFDDQDARWVEERGGIPIVYSDAAAQEFLGWFDRRFDLAEDRRARPREEG